MNKTLPVISTILAWLLAAFFLFGAWGNTFISAENAAAYPSMTSAMSLFADISAPPIQIKSERLPSHFGRFWRPLCA